jgi:hypothetical protein
MTSVAAAVESAGGAVFSPLSGGRSGDANRENLPDGSFDSPEVGTTASGMSRDAGCVG